MGNDNKALVPAENAVASIVDEMERCGWGKSITPQVRHMVARLAVAYGLDPMRGHVELLGGRPYITVAGLSHNAQNRELLDGDDVEIVRFENDECTIKETLYAKGCSHPFVAFGHAGGKAERNPVARANPLEMAQTRALGRALRKATGIALPFAEELDGAAQVERQHGKMQPARTVEVEAKPAADKDAIFRVQELAAQLGIKTAGELYQRLRTAGATVCHTEGRKLMLDRYPDEILNATAAILEREISARDAAQPEPEAPHE